MECYVGKWLQDKNSGAISSIEKIEKIEKIEISDTEAKVICKDWSLVFKNENHYTINTFADEVAKTLDGMVAEIG
ncbi:hypothetical protein [Hydrogenimonas cancrithermarum]|uniref:Uncharacterized protein n=1 Tax=Hydrogenimonas cancrithermarum TaxID=2993563 RepID=A0ABN6WXE8_9BACT|nr:hypothetical protein [Hydrogenimonas cancrithermarum]BDY13975.1 hypothetical protein HCR_22880 [Hydrogenimonas cancrithermarum]